MTANGGPIGPGHDDEPLAWLNPGYIIPASQIPEGFDGGVAFRDALAQFADGVYVAPSIGVNFVEPWVVEPE